MAKFLDRQMKVLIVDDEKEIRDMVTDAIKDCVGRIVPAKDGHEAIFKVNNEHFNLLITDLKMPRMDGIQLIQTMRRLEHDIPVLIISAFAQDFEAELKKLSNFTILQKPFTLEQLEDKVASLSPRVKREPSTEPVMEDLQLKAGADLFKEGDAGDEMFFIKSGSLDLYKSVGGQEVFITNIKTGEIVGELSPLIGAKRSATARAHEDVLLMKIPEGKLQEAIQHMPKWLKVLLHTVVGRLSDTTNNLASAKKEIEDLRK